MVNIMRKTSLLITLLLTHQSLLALGYESAIEKARFLIKEHQKQTNIPGIQVALMVEDTLVWSEGFGFSDLSQKTPVNQSTKFRIASISKPVTSVALGKMIEQGTIEIDKDINFYLPEFPKKNYSITSRQLAASTSGIRHYSDEDPLYNEINYPNIISSLNRFKDDKLLFKPGSEHHYSSYGWVLLSAVMEKAASQSFTELMDDAWNELGMFHTTFDLPEVDISNKSKHYVSGKKDSRTEAHFDNRSYMYAGGGYLSTAEDLVLLGGKLLNNQFISAETKKLLFSSYKLQDGTDTKYGLGWESGVNRTITPVVYHSGSMPSARSHLVIFPEKGVVFAYLANTGDNIFFNEREAHSIAELFVDTQVMMSNQSDALIGEWEIKSTSLRNRKTSGTLELSQNISGIIEGSITFKRSKKKKTFPIIFAESRNNQYHLIGVSPMFFDLYLTINEGAINGYWLHDFNVNGTPEQDDYWKPRDISAIKTRSEISLSP